MSTKLPTPGRKNKSIASKATSPSQSLQEELTKKDAAIAKLSENLYYAGKCIKVMEERIEIMQEMIDQKQAASVSNTEDRIARAKSTLSRTLAILFPEEPTIEKVDTTPAEFATQKQGLVIASLFNCN